MQDQNPYQIKIPDKFYFKIGEVSKIAGLPSHVLRFWETEFKRIKPRRTESGQRSYTKKDIGIIYTGENYNVNLVSGELKLGELASGEIVASVREKSDEINKKLKAEIMIIDSAAGIGCPVIASLV